MHRYILYITVLLNQTNIATDISSTCYITKQLEKYQILSTKTLHGIGGWLNIRKSNNTFDRFRSDIYFHSRRSYDNE